MERKRVLKKVWDYLAVWVYKTGNLSVSRSRYSNGQTVIEIGWELCLKWKDGLSNWISLKEINNSYHLEVVDYAVVIG